MQNTGQFISQQIPQDIKQTVELSLDQHKKANKAPKKGILKNTQKYSQSSTNFFAGATNNSNKALDTSSRFNKTISQIADKIEQIQPEIQVFSDKFPPQAQIPNQTNFQQLANQQQQEQAMSTFQSYKAQNKENVGISSSNQKISQKNETNVVNEKISNNQIQQQMNNEKINANTNNKQFEMMISTAATTNLEKAKTLQQQKQASVSANNFYNQKDQLNLEKKQSIQNQQKIQQQQQKPRGSASEIKKSSFSLIPKQSDQQQFNFENMKQLNSQVNQMEKLVGEYERRQEDLEKTRIINMYEKDKKKWEADKIQITKDFEKTIENLKEELYQEKSKNKEKNVQLEALENFRIDIDKKYKILEQQKKYLEDEKMSQIKLMTQFQTKIDMYKPILKSKDEQISHLETLLKTIGQTNTKNETQINVIQKTLNQEEFEKKILKEDNDRKFQQVQELQTQVDLLKKQVETLTFENQKLTFERESASKDCTRFQADIQTLRQQNKEVQSRVIEKIIEKPVQDPRIQQETALRIQSLSKEIHLLKEDISKTTVFLQNEKNANQMLNSELQRAKSEFQDLQNASKIKEQQQNDQINIMIYQHQQMQHQLHDLQMKNDELMRNIEIQKIENQKKNSEAIALIAALTERNEQLDVRLSNLRFQMQNANVQF